jgi:hypothetical protein
MYKVGVGYTEWRGGDYNGSNYGAWMEFNFKSLSKAKEFEKDVNDKKKLVNLRDAKAYPARLIETED